MRADRLRPAGAQGETLVELLVAVVIMGIAVVAVVGGIATGITMSDIHRKQATAGAYVRDFAEAIENGVATASKYTTGAAAAATYKPLYTPPNTSYTASITAVSCWNGSAFATVEPCVDTGVQKISVKVASNDGRASETLDAIIRKPCRPPPDAAC
jgi:type II secretory pathway pseudopilin PulG